MFYQTLRIPSEDDPPPQRFENSTPGPALGVPATAATKQRPGEIDLLALQIPNLININDRRQALLVCALPLINPNRHKGL